ncbi:Nif3-like dinuclear metal center hexameric protein [Kiritimatiellaeota bacterium B1221]|nr:Nif3-like dinuclear metal center hexameric protein [Kiritimatiellaeota bacterium B1221]
MNTLDAPDLISLLESFAPPDGAAEWDNTGLLLEAGTEKAIRKILLTLDLTPAVAAEAIKRRADWIIAYHPPIFAGLKTLSRHNPLTAALLDLISAGISVYSPHTALDAADGGVSDWLCSPFPEARMERVEGSGRRLTFKKALSADEVASRIQDLLDSPYLRICHPARIRKIKTLGLCPGAGASVLQAMQADAVFTGEMRHHDMLAWQSAGTAVFLSEHGHTERPYLKLFQQRLKDNLPASVKVLRSRKDIEPVTLVLPHA